MIKSAATYKKDYRFGLKSEDKTLSKLKEILLDETLQHFSSKYSVLDFHSNKSKLVCEVKGRRCKSDTYETTMIGSNKIELAHSLAKKGYTILLFFDFLDGLFYIDFEDWHTISNHKSFSICKSLDGKLYNYIPSDCLVKCGFAIDYTITPR